MRKSTALTLKPGDTVTWTSPPRGLVHEIEFITGGTVRFVTPKGGIRVHKMKTLMTKRDNRTGCGIAPIDPKFETWIPYYAVYKFARAKKRSRDYSHSVC